MTLIHHGLLQDFILPMMLEVPPVPNLSAEGLATTALRVFHDAGFTDEQLEGMGWDGEYVKKGVKSKIVEQMEMEGWSTAELKEWVTEVWEPAHQLELVTKDIKADDLMAWFNDHIQTLNDTTNILGFGKGLEQSLEAAEEVGEKAYKLKSMSGTRFSAYFEGSIKNFERRMETNVEALRKRLESTDKKVREKAAQLLRKINCKQFFLMNLGILDVYTLLGSTSKQLQKVETFPWQIPKVQQELLEELCKMEKLKLSMDEGGQLVKEIDQSVWGSLGKKIDDIMEDKYLSVQTPLAAPGSLIGHFGMTFGSVQCTVHTNHITGMRRGRSAADVSSCQSVLTSVENKLTSLARRLRIMLQERITNNPTPSVIKMMGKCLDLGDILETEETGEIKQEREQNLKKVMIRAKYGREEQEQIVKEYELFKERVKDMNNPEGEFEEIVSRFEHLLFKTHTCQPDCVKVAKKVPGKHDTMVCSEKGKVVQPRKPELMKFLHLIFKEPVLYMDIQNFLHLLLR